MVTGPPGRGGEGQAGESILRGARSLAALDRATVWLERPVRGVAGSHRLNPLPHAGTITVFLLGVVTLSGLYITLFFEFGFEASYRSVSGLEEHPIQRVMRALHRYSSAALVMTTLVHAWRIFVAARFTGRNRRWRWISGLTALLLVWLAGVTGYWLVWDVRAQALNEAVNGLIGGWGWGARLVVRSLFGPGSGATTLLVIWFAHLGLTAAIGWFVFRHLRRTRMAWLPPRVWMGVMGAALLVVSVLLPLGMLAPADSTRLLPAMPIDPFVLFLLPILLSTRPWMAITGAAVVWLVIVLLPRMLRRADPDPVVIDADACTGCELCVIDCPYQALDLVDRPEGRPLAVLDAETCVACGICIGACAFDAISFPALAEPTTGEPSASPDSNQADAVVIVCDRHDHTAVSASSETAEATTVVPIRCAGMLGPSAISHYYEQGATSVHVVGCAPADCRFGVGNQRASERMAGERAPRLPPRWSGMVAEDWVAAGEVALAAAHPGRHPTAAGSVLPFKREAYLGVGAVIAASVLAAALSTRAPFSAGSAHAGVRVVVDHDAGRPLALAPESGFGPIDSVLVETSGRAGVERRVAEIGATSVALLDWEIGEGDEDVEVFLIADEARVLVASHPGPLAAGERVLVDVSDVPLPPDAADGERVFNARASGCAVCHSVVPGDDGVGPSLAGVATTAGDRVEGLSAELYLRQSILLPDQYILDGWPAGQMLPFYRDDLDEDDLRALVAYLLTLEEES